MSAPISSKCGKLKKSKLEKIFELEADLKFMQEENMRLREEMDGNHGGATSPTSSTASESSQLKKVKDAYISLRKVNISSEKALHKMRQHALVQKKELREQESVIGALKKQVESLEQTQEALTNSKSAEGTLQAQLGRLQQALFLETQKSAKRQQDLNERDDAIAKLQERLEVSKQIGRRGSDRSLASCRSSERSLVSRRASEQSLQYMRGSDRSIVSGRQQSEQSLLSMDDPVRRPLITEVSIDEGSSVASTEILPGSVSGRVNRTPSDKNIVGLDSRSVRSSSQRRKPSLDSSRAGRLSRNSSHRSNISVVSGHSQQEIEVAQLKKRLSRKTNHVSELELQIKQMAEEIRQLKSDKLELVSKTDTYDSSDSEEESEERGVEENKEFPDVDFDDSVISFW